MKQALHLILSDEELLELRRILIDRDEAAALAFIDQHLRREVERALEGG